MAKRKSTSTSKNDTRVASIIVGLFAAVVLLFFIFSKAKETHQQNAPAPQGSKEAQEPQEETVPAVPVQVKHPVKTRHPQPFVPQPAPEARTIEPVKGTGGKIAFIIDDWGQTTANCKYLKEIPEPLAVSILPGLRHTKDVANCAQLYHKLAMLHLPLEALHNGDYYPPNYIIKTTMKPDLVVKIVDDDLGQLPSIEGVNNHMGSKATADRPLMSVIFKRIKRKGLFFIDSVTSRYSVSAKLAEEMGLEYGKRDVFLDNINTKDEIVKQLQVLAQKARHRGYAVAIGHDRHLTMQVLKDEIPVLEAQGFEIVSIKSLLKNK